MNVFEQIEGFFTGQFNALKLLYTLLKLETKLARMSIIPMIVSVFLLLIVLFTLWTSIMVLFGYYVFYLTHSILLSIVSICGLNFIMVLGLVKYLSFNIRAMSFEKTRAYLNKPKHKNYDELKKKINSEH